MILLLSLTVHHHFTHTHTKTHSSCSLRKPLLVLQNHYSISSSSSSSSSTMAEHHPQHQMQPHGQPMGATIKNMLPDKGPSTAQVLAVVTLFPIGGILLTLAGLTLTGTIIGLAITTPLFILFSPVLVPAAITIGLAVTGFLASGAFGLTALSSLSWIINYVRGSRVPETLEAAKRRMQETAGHMGQKTKEAGQQIQGKAHEGGR